MDFKLKKSRGFTLALLILTACLVFSLVPTMSVFAKAKNGRYEFYKEWNSSKWVKIKKNRMTTYVAGVYYKNARGKSLKKKKRKFSVSKNCQFYVTSSNGIKHCSYKSFIKKPKKYSILYLWVKKGKVVKAQWHNRYGTH